MSITREAIVERNRAQVGSEVDSFAEDRYRQMYAHLPGSVQNILDVGCNTGRGGRILKRLNPRLQLLGVDCVKDRIASLDPLVYEQ